MLNFDQVARTRRRFSDLHVGDNISLCSCIFLFLSSADMTKPCGDRMKVEIKLELYHSRPT